MTENGKKRHRDAHLGKQAQAADKSERLAISIDRTFAIAPMMDWTDSKRPSL